jgi:hypothetical protein
MEEREQKVFFPGNQDNKIQTRYNTAIVIKSSQQ